MGQTIVEKIAQAHLAEGPHLPLHAGTLSRSARTM